MDGEMTIGDIYEEISERLASARTKALMGERQQAIGIFQGASLDITRFREVLRSYPGYQALEHAFTVTMEALSDEQNIRPAIQKSEETPRSETPVRRKTSGRRKAA